MLFRKGRVVCLDMKYGVDVASTRLDDLDKRLLLDVKERITKGDKVRVLDIGCGQGGLAYPLSNTGAEVVALDIADYKSFFTDRAVETTTSGSVKFIQADIANFPLENLGHFDIVVLQRVLHYLPYSEAKRILKTLRQQTSAMYLAVTGIGTAIARHYNVRTLSVQDRFGELDEKGKESFYITAPLCLYSEEEIKILLEETDWKKTWSRVSDFGNIKVEAE